MGVSGCGKSTVGRLLADRLGFEYAEGDDYHPPSNVEKMQSGIALDDTDRRGWLAALSDRIGAARAQGRGLVVSCSALKRAYRDRLRLAAADLQLVHLAGEFDVLQRRLAARTGHYMPASLLQSQFADLQVPGPDENPLVFPVSLSPDQLVATIVDSLPLLKPVPLHP